MDTYIEKDTPINDEIDKLRNSDTDSLLERRDVIIVASVPASTACKYSDIILVSEITYMVSPGPWTSFWIGDSGNYRIKKLQFVTF